MRSNLTWQVKVNIRVVIAGGTKCFYIPAAAAVVPDIENAALLADRLFAAAAKDNSFAAFANGAG